MTIMQEYSAENASLTPEFTFDADSHAYRLEGEKLLSVTEVCSMINGDKFAINESILRAAQMRGIAVHELTAMYDSNPNDIELDVAMLPYFRAWQSFCRDYDPQWLDIERPIYAKEMMVAGTIDRVGIIDDVPVVVDIKTTASMDRTSQFSLYMQLAGYSMLLGFNGEQVDLQKSMGVQLLKDGTYKVYRYSEGEEKFEENFKLAFIKLANILRKVRGI